MRNPKRKFLSLLLSLLLIMAMVPAALADKSTTTNGSVSIDQNARTELYVVSSTPGSDYPSFGARNEPAGGVYYGRYAASGPVGDGWGLTNMNELSNESAVGQYLELNDAYSLEYWSYIYGTALEGNNRAFLVSINFPGEASDCSAITGGSYDTRLTQDFQYLNTLSCPVFVRIGGEMNVWEPRPDTSVYIDAFRHVVNLLRNNAPRAAAVFSPNYGGANKEDMDSYYPGDEYVDWVGCSLYYDKVHHGTYKNDKFLGVGDVYGDPLLNVQQTVNLSKLHNKPVILTEGGARITLNGNNYSDFASERLDRAMSFLPMVYPEIKCIISSDYDATPKGQGDYTFSKDATANSGYQHAVSNNPVLRHSVNDTPSYYTKASAYNGAWEGAMHFAAYTYSSDRLTATWSVDGQDRVSVSEYPYAFTLYTNVLEPGKHTIKVTFSNGQSTSQEFTTTSQSTSQESATASQSYNAMPTSDKLYVDGVLQNPTVYKIDGNNYFKLRDVAMMLNGSEKQFEVGFDASVGAVQVITGQPYTANGSELAGQASGGKNAVISSSTIYLDGTQATGLTVYNIDGNNYFKLRDLGMALNFFVGWDADASSVTVSGNSSYPY